MLCQLVCTDRRYARMNCFNIRELQGILKRKFFTDLVNSHEHHNLMDKTMIGLRYKSNANISLDNDMLTFYNFGITSQISNQASFFISSTSQILPSRPTISNFNLYMFHLLTSNEVSFSARITKLFSITFSDLSSLLLSPNPLSLINFFTPKAFSRGLLNNFNFLNYNSNELLLMFNYPEYTTNDNGNRVFFGGKAIGSNFSSDEVKNIFSENSSAQRFTRFSSSLINYDYKTGHYIGNWDAQYPFLLTSFIEVARGIRKPS